MLLLFNLVQWKWNNFQVEFEAREALLAERKESEEHCKLLLITQVANIVNIENIVNMINIVNKINIANIVNIVNIVNCTSALRERRTRERKRRGGRIFWSPEKKLIFVLLKDLKHIFMN